MKINGYRSAHLRPLTVRSIMDQKPQLPYSKLHHCKCSEAWPSVVRIPREIGLFLGDIGIISVIVIIIIVVDIGLFWRVCYPAQGVSINCSNFFWTAYSLIFPPKPHSFLYRSQNIYGLMALPVSSSFPFVLIYISPNKSLTYLILFWSLLLKDPRQIKVIPEVVQENKWYNEDLGWIHLPSSGQRG